MLIIGSDLTGYTIEAINGNIGTVSDCLIDERNWKIRWIVVDTGTWLSERKVLIHPSAVHKSDCERRQLSVDLTKAKIEASPGISTDEPVSLQMEKSMYDYYGWNSAWDGGGYFNGYMAASIPASLSPSYGDAALLDVVRPQNGDPHLRSISELEGYRVHAKDGAIGHVQKFVLDNISWDVRYLVVDTKNWWFGQHVLLSPFAVRNIDWSNHEIRLDLSRDRIRTSPPWNASELITENYQKKLHDYYAWHGYGR